MPDWNRGYRPTGRFYGPGWEGTPAQDAARHGEEALDAVGTAVDYLGPYQTRYAVGGERMAKEPTLAEALVVDPYLFLLPRKVAQLTRGLKHLKRTEGTVRGVSKTKGLKRLRSASRVGKHLKPEKALGDIGHWPTWEVPQTLAKSLSNLRRTHEAVKQAARNKLTGQKGWKPGSSVRSGSPGVTRREANKWLGLGGLGAALGGGAVAVKMASKTGKMTALPVDDLATILRYNMKGNSTASSMPSSLYETLAGLRKTPADEAFDYIPAPARGETIQGFDTRPLEIKGGGFDQSPMRLESPEELIGVRRHEVMNTGLDDIATEQNYQNYGPAWDKAPDIEGSELSASVYEALAVDIERKYANLVMRPGPGHRAQVKRMVEEAYAPGTRARAELDDAAARMMSNTKYEDAIDIDLLITDRQSYSHHYQQDPLSLDTPAIAHYFSTFDFPSPQSWQGVDRPWASDQILRLGGGPKPSQFWKDIHKADKRARAHLEKHGYAGLADVPEFYDGIIIPKINKQADLIKWGLPKKVLDRRLNMKQRFDQGIFTEGWMGRNPLSGGPPGGTALETGNHGLMDPEAWMNLSQKEHVAKPNVGMRRGELQEALKGRELVDEIPAVRIGKKIKKKIRDRNK